MYPSSVSKYHSLCKACQTSGESTSSGFMHQMSGVSFVHDPTYVHVCAAPAVRASESRACGDFCQKVEALK